MLGMKLILIAVALVYAQASCPGACSGHGSCQEHDTCKCMPRWIGPDCASRECAFGLSWVAARDNADCPAGGKLGGQHAYTECSSRGTCDRDSGECECFPGYEGSGCSRTACPNDCSGHGRCQYNSEISSEPKKLWDSDMTRQCTCDRGYEGVDCSSRICPKGDDPLTDCSDGTEVSKQLVRLYPGTQDDGSTAGSLAPGGSFTLTFTDMFNGEYTTRPITMLKSVRNTITYAKKNAALADFKDEIKSALEELPNFAIPSVDVTLTKGSNGLLEEYTHDTTLCTLAPTTDAGTTAGSCTCDGVYNTGCVASGSDSFGGTAANCIYVAYSTADELDSCTSTSHTYRLADTTLCSLSSGDTTFTPGSCACENTNNLNCEKAECVYVAGVYTPIGANPDTVETPDSCMSTHYSGTEYSLIGSSSSAIDKYYEFAVTFTDPANSGKQNLLEVTMGASDNANMQPRFVPVKSIDQSSALGCNGEASCGVSWTVVHEPTTAEREANDEHVQCSNRGICDGSTGVCGCFEGYTGEACAVQTVFF